MLMTMLPTVAFAAEGDGNSSSTGSSALLGENIYTPTESTISTFFNNTNGNDAFRVYDIDGDTWVHVKSKTSDTYSYANFFTAPLQMSTLAIAIS